MSNIHEHIETSDFMSQPTLLDGAKDGGGVGYVFKGGKC